MNGSKAREAVQKLWSASRSLQGGGVTYYEYVTELTYLLLLKMLEEVSHDGNKLEQRIPADCRWAALKKIRGEAQLVHYRKLLTKLGTSTNFDFPLVKSIYADAKTSLTRSSALASLIKVIDDVEWHDAEEDGLGNLYEGLLEKTSSERKSKAGQYFTPRPLINTIIHLMKPKAGEIIQDPAAGTGGFLIAAHRAIMKDTDNLAKLTPDMLKFQHTKALQGAELITGTHRLNTMNLLLHGIERPILCIDTLTPEASTLSRAKLIITNPPFNKFPERVLRSEFQITRDAAKGPLPFVEHVVRNLEVGGRAAIVLPDNVLFEENMGRDLRIWLMDLCDLHTILRLPTGIFYALGVKTNVLFLKKLSEKRVGATKEIWFYDLRTQMPSFGKFKTLTETDFLPFVSAYGDDPLGGSPRKDEGVTGRFRVFSREEIRSRNDNLDLRWLDEDEEKADEGLTDPEDIAAAILGHLRAAADEIEAVADDLAETERLRK